MKKTQKGKDITKEDIGDKDNDLQAIILADNFSKKFLPLNIKSPRALMPLGNVMIIDYVIQFLLINKIKNIIIFGTSHKEQLDEYFKKYKSKEFSLKIVSSDDCLCIGDALRNIERMNLIKGDFILMSCDVVANFKLEKAIIQYRTKRKESKSYIMTKIYKRLPFGHALRTNEDDIALVVDESRSQLLQIENLSKTNCFKIRNTMDFKASNNNYKIYYDLYDTNVTICSLEVLHHFMDNFDFTSFSDEFIKDLITSEIFDDKINIFIINDEEYAASIKNLRLYKNVLRDLTSQWVQPLVIHKLASKIRDKAHYHYYSDNIYISSDVERSLNGFISNNCIIGKNTKFKENVEIIKSSLGNDCHIGKNVKIIDSIIWDKVIIEDNCTIQGSLICSDVIIKSNSTIQKGSILNSDVIVKENTTVPAGSIVSMFSSGKNDEILGIPTNNDYFERGGLCESSLKTDEKFVDMNFFEMELYDDESLNDEESELEDAEETVDFFKEVCETIHRVHTKESTIQTVLFEINNLKFGENKTFADCIFAFMPEILGELLKIDESSTPDIITKQIKETLEFWKPLMVEYSHSIEDGVFLIKEIIKFCNNNARFKSSFHVILQLMFVNKIIDGEKILSWATNENIETNKYYLDLCEKFVQYLKNLNEADEEEDDEEEEEEGNEEEEEK